MRLGILTFHRAINVGAVLQAYALQQTLRKLGHETYIIDYQPDYVEKAYKSLRKLDIRHPAGLLYELSTSFMRKRRLNKYRRFREQYLNIKPLHVLSSCDYAILGSDQIWNSSITGGRFDLTFFNKNSEVRAKRGIAYAASTMSVDRLTDKDFQDFSKFLPTLNAIGVRERKFAQFLSDKYRLKITEVIDPTLLADPYIFEPFVSKSPCEKEYLVFYEIWHSDEIEKKAREIAQEKGLKFIGISGSDIRFTNRDIHQSVSPSSFVNYIAHASHIITSSFHGTAFSLIFNKQFNVICEKPHQSNRMQELLDNMGLSNKLTFKSESVDGKLIDYDLIRARLDALRRNSIKFIIDNII